MPKIFDREDEPNDFMEMPCRCDCGKWFDLNDGYTSERDRNKVICGACGEVEEKEIEREEDIASWKDALANAEEDVKSCKAELKKLGIETDPPPPASAVEEAARLYPDIPTHGLDGDHSAERDAHITCARMYTGEIERLKAENSKMRNALEWYADAGNYLGDNGELATAWKQNENIKNKATEAIKSPNV